MPSATPVAAAASALVTLWRPASASVTSCCSPPASSMKRRTLLVVGHVADRAHVRGSRAAVRDDPRLSVAGHAGHPRVVGVEHGHAVGRQRAHETGLLLAHAVERAEELGVHRGDGRHDRHRRLRQRGQRGDLTAGVGADLQHRGLVLGAQAQQRQRQPPLVVERALRLEHVPARGHHAGGQLLGRRLAVAAGHGDHRDGEARAVERGQPAQRLRGVLDEHQRHVGRHVVGQRVDDEARGAARGGVGEERVTVQAMAVDGEEGLARRRASASRSTRR
jgi:hypothetical protein